jgi:translation initiation factor 5A
MPTTTIQMRGAKPGSYIIIDGEACKVNSMTKSKPGKHGAAKVRLEAVGLFDGKKRVLLKPADASVESPIIEKKKAQAISISGNIVELMDLESYETFEASIPEEFKARLVQGAEGAEVLYWKFEGNIIIKEVRTA